LQIVSDAIGSLRFDIVDEKAARAAAWIPVSERLPKDGASALIFVPEWEDAYLRYRVAWINYDESPPVWVFNGESVEGVTAWQELPAPPLAQAGAQEKKP